MITKNKTVNQLTALKEWSQNPTAYQKKLADKKLIKWALEESPVPIVKNPVMKKAISDAEIQKRLDKARGPSDWEMIYEGMTPIEKGQWNAEKRKQGLDGKRAIPLEDIKKKKTIEPVEIDFDLDINRVAKKPRPKPTYLNGNVIDMIPFMEPEEWWKPRPEKPENEDTSIPIEERIKRIAQAKENDTKYLGIASLL